MIEVTRRPAAFSSTPTLLAVRAGRVVHVDPDLVNRAGPRLADGLAAVGAAVRGP